MSAKVLTLGIVIGFILAFMIMMIPTDNESYLIHEGVDYIELVDNVCYRTVNEHTEEIFNITLSPEDTQSDDFRFISGLATMIDNKINE